MKVSEMRESDDMHAHKTQYERGKCDECAMIATRGRDGRKTRATSRSEKQSARARQKNRGAPTTTETISALIGASATWRKQKSAD